MIGHTIQATAIALLAAVCLSGCNGGSSPTAPATAASLAISGTVPAVGQTSQLTAIATLSNSTTTDVTSLSTWSSSDTTIATVSTTGVLTVVTGQPASATITATYQSQSGQFVVVTQPLKSISITAPPILTVPQQIQLTATANFRDGTTQDVTGLATWGPSGGTLSEPWFAVSAGGVVTALQPLQSGSTIPFPRVTAAYLGSVGTAAVSIALPCQLDAVTGSLPGMTALAPAFARFSPPSTGGAFTVTVQGPSNCAWTTVAVDATENTFVPSAFAAVTGGGSGTGNGAVSFSIGSHFTNGAIRIIPAGAGDNALLVSPLGVIEWFAGS